MKDLMCVMRKWRKTSKKWLNCTRAHHTIRNSMSEFTIIFHCIFVQSGDDDDDESDDEIDEAEKGNYFYFGSSSNLNVTKHQAKNQNIAPISNI